jgi:hypothetical protein
MKGKETQKIAGNFEGFGPIIYSMSVKNWRDLLGNHNAGDAVYAMLLSVRDKKGACPSTIVLNHGGGRHGPKKSNDTAK